MRLIKNGLFVVILIILFVISIGIVSAEKQSGAASKEQGPVKELRLNPVDFGNNTEYGRSVAIDDNLIAVGMGADGQDGRVYLYRRQGTNYVPEATLSEPAGTAGAEFGRSVVIKGNTVFVGARFAQAGDVSKAGAIYVFRNSKGSWHFEEKIVSPDPKSEDNFGRALSVQGNLMVVTARKENQSDPDVGAAYVFVNKGGIWTFKQKITASDPNSECVFWSIGRAAWRHSRDWGTQCQSQRCRCILSLPPVWGRVEGNCKSDPRDREKE